MLLSLLLVPSLVGATSGACSYHGGVNCAAGADYDGSAICNDGWRDSSVSYADMTECKTSHSCTPEQLSNLESKYGIKTQQKQIDELTKEMNRAVENKYDNSLSEEKRSEASETFYEVTSQILPLQSKLRSDIERLGRDCDVLGEENYKDLLRQEYEALQAQSEIKCPANATRVGNQCFCNAGFSPNGSSCVATNKTIEVPTTATSNFDRQVSPTKPTESESNTIATTSDFDFASEPVMAVRDTRAQHPSLVFKIIGWFKGILGF